MCIFSDHEPFNCILLFETFSMIYVYRHRMSDEFRIVDQSYKKKFETNSHNKYN